MEALSGYRNLSKGQQGDLLDIISAKIESLIGAHGDIKVLVEYITVMLQSNQSDSAIENELEAFLQDQSKEFVEWLAKQVEAMEGGGKATVAGKSDAGAAADSPNSKASPRDSKTSPRNAKDRSRSPATKTSPRKPAALGLKNLARTPVAARKKRAGGGMAASLFGRAVRDAQRSVKTKDGAEDRGAAADHKESPPAKQSKPKLAPRSPQASGSESDSRSRSRSRTPPPTSSRGASQLQGSPAARANSLASAVAAAAASTRSQPGLRNLPPRPRLAPPLPPPPRALPMHMVPGYPAPLHHGGLPYHSSPVPGPPPATAPPRPGPPPPGRPAAASSSDARKGRARLAPVKMEDDDASRWHFSAPAGSQRAAGPPPRTPPPAAYIPAGPLPHQMVAGAPGYQAYQAPQALAAPAAAAAAVGPVSAAQAHAAPPPPVSSTVFEVRAAPVAIQPAPAAQRSGQSVSAPPRPRNFVPQKWRITTADLVVGTSENLDSKQVRTLREGEIVESVGPPFTLTNGVVRLEIRHPSSAAYPNPIGWVTQDDTATGGTKNLQPGPQPVQATMQKGTPRPPSFGGGWRPSAKGKGRGKASFTNVSWRPPS